MEEAQELGRELALQDRIDGTFSSWLFCSLKNNGSINEFYGS